MRNRHELHEKNSNRGSLPFRQRPKPLTWPFPFSRLSPSRRIATRRRETFLVLRDTHLELLKSRTLGNAVAVAGASASCNSSALSDNPETVTGRACSCVIASCSSANNHTVVISKSSLRMLRETRRNHGDIVTPDAELWSFDEDSRIAENSFQQSTRRGGLTRTALGRTLGRSGYSSKPLDHIVIERGSFFSKTG